MSSDAKIKANQENAKHSTGPVTEEGKARSAQNARKHGLSGKSVFIPEDRLDEFKDLYIALYDEVRPVGELQGQYFDQLTHAAWHTVLAREFLAQAYYEADERKISIFTRLLGQHERAYARAHKALVQMQTGLAVRALAENEPIAGVPLTVNVQTVANEARKLAAQHPVADRRKERFIALYQVGVAFQAAMGEINVPSPESAAHQPAA